MIILGIFYFMIGLLLAWTFWYAFSPIQLIVSAVFWPISVWVIWLLLLYRLNFTSEPLAKLYRNEGQLLKGKVTKAIASEFGVVWARYSTDKDGKQYFVDAQSGQVHSAHVAEFLKEIAEVQRKYDLDINAGADTLRVGSLSPEYGHSIFYAIDETGTKEDLEMRELIRCERRKALYEYHKGQK